MANESTMNLWPEPLVEEGGDVTAAVTIEDADGNRDKLWYRFPAEHREAICESADPLLIGAMFPVMENAAKAGGPFSVKVHGSVSPSLIRNLDEFQVAWSIWQPEVYGRAEIQADEEREANEGPSDEQAVMCFSGGLDSCFTAYRHAGDGAIRCSHNLRAGVMAQGMEFKLHETEIFLEAEKRSKTLLDSLGIPLIRVTTNYKEIISKWPFSHGSAVASCVALLQKRFNLGLIAQTMTYRNNHMLSEGVNPTSDWLFSSDSFQLKPDGAGQERLEKMDSLRDWPEFLEHMRVCFWGGEEKPTNCCKCEKCIQTILHFRVLGLGLPKAFPKDVTDRQILGMECISEVHIAMAYGNILEEARRRGITESWVDALDGMIRRNRLQMRMVKMPRWRRSHHTIWHKVRDGLNLP